MKNDSFKTCFRLGIWLAVINLLINLIPLFYPGGYTNHNALNVANWINLIDSYLLVFYFFVLLILSFVGNRKELLKNIGLSILFFIIFFLSGLASPLIFDVMSIIKNPV